MGSGRSSPIPGGPPHLLHRSSSDLDRSWQSQRPTSPPTPSVGLGATISRQQSQDGKQTPSTASGRTSPSSSANSSAHSPAVGGTTRSSLASRRRQAQPLTVNTRRSTKKGIKWTDHFHETYKLGSEVMPSCHRGMQVLHATHIVSNTAVVIKVRSKPESFRTRGEETEWRENTEFVLNLPKAQTIAALHEVLEDRRAYYVVMEKVQGLDLFESLAGEGPLSVTEIKDVLRQLLTALDQLHQSGAIHKDLKLENVMVERSPVSAKSHNYKRSSSQVSVKLIDFDTVEEFSPKTPKSAKDVLGTDQYISQEAYDGNYSPASDIFAVGVIAYKLLTGRFPFDSKIFNDEAGENWVGSPKMKEIRDKVKNFDINWGHRIFVRYPLCADLTRKMLAPYQEDRPSAREALSHSWLSSSPSASQAGSGAGGALPNCVDEATAVG